MDPPYDDRKRKTGSKQSFNLLRIMNGIIRYPHLAGAYYLQGSCSPHYFETVERYYQTGNEEQKAYIETLRSHFTRCEPLRAIYEAFYGSLRLPVDKLGIRKLDWLS